MERARRRSWAIVLAFVAACTPAPTPSPTPVATAPAAPSVAPTTRPSPAPTSTITPTATPVAPAYPLDPASFTTLPPLAEARYMHTATLLRDGRVLVAGGRFLTFGDGASTDEYFRSVELFDPTTRTWFAGPPMQRARYGHSAVLLQDGRLLVAGGDVRADGQRRAATIEIFDPATNDWILVSDLPTAPSGAVVLSDGRVMLIGFDPGIFSNKSFSTTFDPVTRRFGPLVRITGVSVNPAVARLLDGRVLAAGGWRGYGDGPPENRAEAAIFDPAAGAWSTIAPMRHARPPSTMVTLADGRAVIASDATAELFDPSSGTWTLTDDTTSARDGTLLVPLLDGRVAAIGSPYGYSDSVPIIEVLDPATGVWSTLAGFRVLESLSATMLPDGSILLAGGLLECRFGQACDDVRVVADIFLFHAAPRS